jgi:hypothetical protein
LDALVELRDVDVEVLVESDAATLAGEAAPNPDGSVGRGAGGAPEITREKEPGPVGAHRGEECVPIVARRGSPPSGADGGFRTEIAPLDAPPKKVGSKASGSLP